MTRDDERLDPSSDALGSDALGSDALGRVDLGALDPSRDAARWQRRIGQITAEAMRRRRRTQGLAAELLIWSRPALAVAAVLALLVWSQALLTERRATERSALRDRQARTASVLAWAERDQVPSSEMILWALEGSHASE